MPGTWTHELLPRSPLARGRLLPRHARPPSLIVEQGRTKQPDWVVPLPASTDRGARTVLDSLPEDGLTPGALLSLSACLRTL